MEGRRDGGTGRDEGMKEGRGNSIMCPKLVC